MKIAKREQYINKLASKQFNGRIKVLTGIRRCGKSKILFELYRDYLLETGVNRKDIIAVALDDDVNEKYRNPDNLSAYVREKCADSKKKYYLFIDEIQYAITREELKDKDRPVKLYSVLNGLLHLGNIDIYVTGSNSKMLSKDISTEFRGRGDVIQIHPLSFKEFYETSGMDKNEAYDEYSMYGGMPYLLSLNSDEDKYEYLENLFEEIYFKDIEERYEIELPSVLRDLTTVLCSSVGSLTNASKTSRSVFSLKNTKVSPETVSLYMSYLTDSFLFKEALKYDIKGKKYYEYPSKFYCTDIGLRNIRLGLRQMEETHISENIIYNELINRGYAVDVGSVEIVEKDSSGKRTQKDVEVDFVARKGNRSYYIQSALNMDDKQKQSQELRPLLKINDSFKKIVVSKSYGKSWFDEYGILHINLIDFLLDQDSLNR